MTIFKQFPIGSTVERIMFNNGAYARIGQRARVVGHDKGYVLVDYPGRVAYRSRPHAEAWMPHYVSLVAEPVQAPPSTPKLSWTTLVGEKSRTYHFADGSKFTVENATHLAVRPTNHRLQTADGKKFVIPGKFIAIEIDAQDWTA